MSSRRAGDFHLVDIFWFGISVLALWASLAVTGFAQGEASIQGTVSDSSGVAVPGVAIRIKNLETGAERNLVTDEAGRFDAASLPVGRYEVQAGKAGFRSEVKTGISVVVGQRETVDFVLQVGDVQQTVQVESAPTVVAVTTEDVSGLVGERQVKDLPLNGRSYDQLITLNPGVVNYRSLRAGGIGTQTQLLAICFLLPDAGRRKRIPAASVVRRALRMRSHWLTVSRSFPFAGKLSSRLQPTAPASMARAIVSATTPGASP